MKLAVGTVQFGLNYGINNELGKPSLETVTDILKLASLNKIDTLDTADSYGDSENIIGISSNFGFKIVSKFSKIKNLSEGIQQQRASLKFIEKYPTANLVGKSKTGNLLFTNKNNSYRISTDGKLL